MTNFNKQAGQGSSREQGQAGKQAGQTSGQRPDQSGKQAGQQTGRPAQSEEQNGRAEEE